MRKLLVVLMLTALPLTAQNLYQDFDYVTVTGTVVTTDGVAVADCKVELRIVSQGGLGVGVLTSGSRNTTRMKKAGWSRTDAKGMYKINGVPIPGSYVVVVRAAKGFKPAQMPLRIDGSAGKTVNAGKLILEKFRDIDSRTNKLMKKAGKALKDGKLIEAEKLLKEAEARTPDLPEIHVSLGNIYLKQKNSKAAYAQLKRAFDLGERNSQLCMTAAQLAFHFHQFTDAEQFLDEVIAREPGNLQALYLAGVSCYNRKNFEKASHYFEQYMKAKTGKLADANFLYVYGMSELQRGNDTAATKLLQDAYNSGWKADVGFLKTLANLYIKQKKNAEAKTVLKDLLEKFPSFNGRKEAERVYNSL